MQIKEWQQGNNLNITLRGHFSGIPDSSTATTTVTEPNIFETLNNSNYNLEFDSYYAPYDMIMDTVTVKSPFIIPEGVEMLATVIKNDEILDVIPIVQGQSENIKSYGEDCAPRIWEDDFIRIVIAFNGNYDLLQFNDNNIVISISGCAAYDMYTPVLIPDEWFVYEESGPTYGWVKGYDLFKTGVKLHNRSGNEIFAYNSYVDEVKSTTSFLIQGFYLYIFDDLLMRTNKIKSPETCFYLDLLINNKSVTEYLGLPRLIQLNTDTNTYEVYQSFENNNADGYPVSRGDIITLKLYTKKKGGLYNGKIIECMLMGCSEDCASLEPEIVNVYERCEGVDECEWKFGASTELLPTDSNVIVGTPESGQTITPVIPERPDRDYVTLNSAFVTINGQKIWI